MLKISKRGSALMLGVALLAFGAGYASRGLIAEPLPAPKVAAAIQAASLPVSVIIRGKDQTPDPARVAGLQEWISTFKSEALAGGIRQDILDTAFADVTYNPVAIERSRYQPEFKKSIWEYLENAVSEKRQVNGRIALAQYDSALSGFEAGYGVDKEIVTAIWGMESSYGERRGDLPLIEALASVAYDGPRQDFFRKQLFAALEILQSGDIDPAHMFGSWAGAMGHTQFIPTTYQERAVDATGDGKRNVWSDDPSDALASTANFLAEAGWQENLPAAVEVKLPLDFDITLAGKGKDMAKPVSEWRDLGISAATTRPLPVDGTSAELLLPTGPTGAAFLITRNFHVIRRYNQADSYALAVSLLADRLQGYPELSNPWPEDMPGLRLTERKELQDRLTQNGYDTQGIDGNVGKNTIDAIKAYQQSRGLDVTGEPSKELLEQLRQS